MPDKEKADKRQSLNSNSDASVSSIPKRNNSALNAGHRPVSLIVTGDLTAPPSPNPAVRKRQPQNFEFLDILGEGSYATVQLANEIETGKTFAIKILDKAHIVKEKKVKYVNLEKVVFNKLHGSPCFVKLYYTFQDPAKLCIRYQ